jgi:acyl-coenzyme A synthetase/AMP-(fatty) acid ligase
MDNRSRSVCRGELYIGGQQVTRGYLGRPEATAERFIPDSFSRRPGARLYRTGDRAKRRADGTVEFLGRIDHQVKLRGFRIELGDIEAQLRREPGVADAVTVVRETGDGTQQLVTYLAGTLDAGCGPAFGPGLRFASLNTWCRNTLSLSTPFP